MNYQSQLLVASPSLADPNFRQTVVLILFGSDEETFGITLNRQSERSISDVWQSIFEKPCEAKQPIYVGGPVFGPLIGLHTRSEVGGTEILPGLYFSTQKSEIEELVSDTLHSFRLFIGGAGWGEQQLRAEIDQGAWYMIPATISDVFEDPTEMWKKSLAKAGRGMLASILHRDDIPEDPNLN